MKKNKDKKTAKNKSSRDFEKDKDITSAEGVSEDVRESALAAVSKERRAGSGLRILNQMTPLIFGTLAVFIIFCLFFPSSAGKLGGGLCNLLRGSLALGAYFIPVFLIIGAICWKNDAGAAKRIIRFVFSVLCILALSTLYYMITVSSTERVFNSSEFYSSGCDMHGGGLLGSAIGYSLWKGVGSFGTWIISLLILFLYCVIFLGLNVKKIMISLSKKIKNKAKDYSEKRKEAIIENTKNAPSVNLDKINAPSVSARVPTQNVAVKDEHGYIGGTYAGETAGYDISATEEERRDNVDD